MGNESAIAALVQLLDTTESEVTQMETANALKKIAVGNESVIAALVQLLDTTESEDTRGMAADILGKIDVGNESAIAALVQLLDTTKSEFIQWRAVDSLGEIAIGNESAIAALFQLLTTTESFDAREDVDEALGKIAVGNESAIAALVRLLATTESINIRESSAAILEKVAVKNESAIAALTQILFTTKTDDIKIGAAYTLGEIGVGNETEAAALVEFLATAETEEGKRMAVYSLGKIGVGNESAIAAVAQLLATTKSEDVWEVATRSLEKLLVTIKRYARVVSDLKDFLADEVYQNDFEQFEECYEVVWHCAQNLSYPDFYQAWHHQTATPEALFLNWDNFPQNLAQALKEQPELADKISVTCIDASQFLNPDNPASEIYVKLVKAGYPRSADGTPRDLQSLKVYCELECPEACLIFYEAPSNPSPQGFSPIFLNALSRFSPANHIAIVSEKPDSSVQTFSPTHPNLIPNLIAWMRGTVLED